MPNNGYIRKTLSSKLQPFYSIQEKKQHQSWKFAPKIEVPLLDPTDGTN